MQDYQGQCLLSQLFFFFFTGRKDRLLGDRMQEYGVFFDGRAFSAFSVSNHLQLLVNDALVSLFHVVGQEGELYEGEPFVLHFQELVKEFRILH